MSSPRLPIALLVAVLAGCGLMCGSGDGGQLPRPLAETIPVDGPFVYEVRYLGITCGHMTLQNRLEEYDGRPAYHIVMRARNAKFFNKIYRVDARIDSWVDRETLGTLAYESAITEKGRLKILRFEVDEKAGVIRGVDGDSEIEIEHPGGAVLDPLAFVMRLRSALDVPDDAVDLQLITTRGVLSTRSSALEMKKKNTVGGRKALLKVRPEPVDNELFSRKGEFVLWVDPGPARTLHRLDFKLNFGRLIADMESRDGAGFFPEDPSEEASDGRTEERESAGGVRRDGDPDAA
jgi:hypothetical protein